MADGSSSKPVIGLSGGIGSGKSAVADILAELGCVVTRSDEDGRAALRDPAVRDVIVAWWGRDVLDASGQIDRAAVARIVFRDAGQRRRLEALTHPWIEARRLGQWRRAPADAPAFVIDAPLLFEVGLDVRCDAVIFVDADREVRLERVRRTRGWNEAELAAREDSQMPLDAKRAKADYVLENSGDLSELSRNVRQVLDEIIRKHREEAQGLHPKSSPSGGPTHP